MPGIRLRFDSGIISGQQLTENNSPDFTRAELIQPTPADLRRVSEAAAKTAKKQNIRSVGIFAAAIAIALYGAYKMTSIAGHGSFALAPAIFAGAGVIVSALLYNGKFMHFKDAAAKGEIQIYGFDLEKKFIRNSEHSSDRYYVCIGGAEVSVSHDEYDSVSGISPVYCAVLSYNNKRYFCYLGNIFLEGGRR